MRIVFFGSPIDAAPSLRVLQEGGHEIACVYTQPDRPAGRAREPVPTPVRQAAVGLGIPTRTPKSLRDESVQAELASLSADVFVVVAYGRILPPPVLAMPRLGVLNVHPSMLPRYRGPSPVASAILDGAKATGVTIMLLDEGMDTGPILLQSEPVPLRGDETTGDLTRRLFEMGVEMLPGALDGLEAGTVRPREQDDSQATVTRLLSREDGALDWRRPAEHLERMVRAHDPWPGTHTSWKGKGLKVLEAQVAVGDAAPGGQPGRVTVHNGRMFVSAGDGALELLRVQLEGRRPVDSAEFLRGYPEVNGSVLPS
ncbi:MAG: methionyl-tRNA formyltransferase [Dehalococcoidia bacterium]